MAPAYLCFHSPHPAHKAFLRLTTLWTGASWSSGLHQVYLQRLPNLCCNSLASEMFMKPASLSSTQPLVQFNADGSWAGPSFKLSICPDTLDSVIGSKLTQMCFCIKLSVCPATTASVSTPGPLQLLTEGFSQEHFSLLMFPFCFDCYPMSPPRLDPWVTLRDEPLSCIKNLLLLM